MNTNLHRKDALMTALSNLPDDVALSIIALPFKAGMWVSHADDVDGEADDDNEMRALEKGIPAIARLHGDSPLVQDVAQALIRNKSRWDGWTEECFFIAKQAPDIMQAVKTHFGLDEAKVFKRYILELAKMVAEAHGEFAAFDDMDEGKKDSFFSGMVGKFVGALAMMGDADQSHPANISPSEKSAMSQLSAALKIPE